MSYEVGVALCATYDRDEVAGAVAKAVERAGGMPAITADEVLIKTNLLSPSEPEKAVTTHPEVLRAIISEIRKSGDFPVHIADNPGYIFTGEEILFSKTGVKPVAETEGATVGILSDKGVDAVRKPDFKTLDEARISRRYLDAGYCVNAAKLKTHVETEVTGCVKNIFGTSDTSTRKKCHNSTSHKRLANAIVDLYTVRPPEFHIMDAIVGMEGDGPSHGNPRFVGFILAGRNALAVDWVEATIMGYKNPPDIPLFAAAVERGIGPRSRDDITLNGVRWDELPVKGFKKSSGLVRLFPTFLRGLAHKLVAISPKLVSGECIRCGICKKVCPVNAISDKTSGDGRAYPHIDAAKCVSCLCCHEMCPTGAMRAHKNILARLVANSRV
ncbi:MAG: DUF362 domain-containing protein [Synergistaceae bacterium]|jgi:uncharacterized protein (DUF362 family)/Pyruvate/2-oxoacid:ferredoxin oxidoreductase delta subunit|nr:DUF362 domain-containing protein [Synergistaceae bacterium]